MNIKTALFQATDILKNNLIQSASLDSEILLAKALNKDRKFILLNPTNIMNKKELNIFKKLIIKRSLRKPVAYLTNTKFFWNSEFKITEDTLIPRPDTEIVVDAILKLTKYKNKLSILDIGVGSGCILLSILRERKDYKGIGIDISKNCLNISKINAINLNVISRLKLIKSNVDKFKFGKYDLIVSNPPYVNKFKIKCLESDVANYEPKLALDGGFDGLSEIKKVIKKSSELIKKNGKFILEIGFDQKNSVVNLIKQKGFYINSVLKDFAKNDRCIISTKI